MFGRFNRIGAAEMRMSMEAYLASSRKGYPGKVAVRQAVEWARELGIDVAGLEMRPDGTVTVLDVRAFPQSSNASISAYDEWKDRM